MALGPKAMGEAIIANRKAKSGKAWPHGSAISSSTESRRRSLLARTFDRADSGSSRAMAVVEHGFDLDPYVEEQRLVDDLFSRYPQQRHLYDEAVSNLDPASFTPKPCRNYLPIYRDGRIAVSFKPTARTVRRAQPDGTGRLAGSAAAQAITGRKLATEGRRVPRRPRVTGTTPRGGALVIEYVLQVLLATVLLTV